MGVVACLHGSAMGVNEHHQCDTGIMSSAWSRRGGHSQKGHFNTECTVY